MNKIFYKFKRATQTMSTALKTMKVAVAIALMTLTAMQAHAQGTGSGTTSGDPRLVNTFAQLKTALESPGISFIEVRDNIDYSLEPTDYVAGGCPITITSGNTYLKMNANVTIRNQIAAPLMYSLINVYPIANLNISGPRTLSGGFNASGYPNAVIFNQGGVTVEQATISGTALNWATYGYAIWGTATSTTTIHSGTFVGRSELATSNAISAVTTDGNLTINGGTFSSSNANPSGGARGVTVQGSTSVNITGGTFKGSGTNIGAGLYLGTTPSAGVMINGGTFEGIFRNTLNISDLLATGYSYYDTSNAVVSGAVTQTTQTVTVKRDPMTTASATVTAPVANSSPVFTATPGGTAYTAKVYEWRSVTGNFVMAPTDKFVGGQTYRAYVLLTPTAGNAFSATPTVTINGNTATYVQDMGSGKIFSYTFTASVVSITAASATVTAPVAGANPSTTATSGGTTYTTSVYNWQDLSNNLFISSANTFASGKAYRVYVQFTPNAGYTFPASSTIQINGQTATYVQDVGSSKIYRLDFPALGDTAPPFVMAITPADESMSNPIAGNIVITFNKAMNQTPGVGTVVLHPFFSGADIPLTGGSWLTATTYSIPYSGLANFVAATSGYYKFYISGFQSAAGVAMAADNAKGFYTVVPSGPSLTVIDILDIPGITPPVPGATPVTFIETAQYTGIVTWGGVEVFDYLQNYIATVILTPKDGYTLTGIPAWTFTVAGSIDVDHPADAPWIDVDFGTTPADNDPPVLSAGSGVRTGAYSAEITFTTTESGTLSFMDVPIGDPAPTKDEIDGGGSPGGNVLAGTINGLYIDGLAGSDARDLYIIVIDAAGNLSEPLKITLAAIGTPLTFTDDAAFDIPASEVGTAITPIDVTSGVAGGSLPYTFSSTILPAGITISTGGLISGAPTTASAAGIDAVTITVTDALLATANITISYGVISPPPPPPLSFFDDAAYDIPTSVTGTPIANIDVSVSVFGGLAPYTFSATGLPAGITISAAGVISGAPTTAGAAGTATITVTDSDTPTPDSQSITIAFGAVTAPGAPLSFTHNTTFDIPASFVGFSITSINVSTGVAGGTAPYTFSATGLPAGISIDPATGIISGTPTTAGAAGTAIITVTDAALATEDITIAFGIISVPSFPLTFTDSPAYDIPASTVGIAIGTVNVSGGVSGGTTPYTFSATGLPAGISISASGVIFGAPATAGAAGTATITVTDAVSATASITIDFGAISTSTTPPPTSPRITGPASMKLTAGYAATSTEAFTVTGTSPVTVAKTSGNAKITWNDLTQKLDIAEGLDIGVYDVSIRATNGVGSSTFTFRLTVAEKTFYLDIPSKFPGGTVIANTANPYLAVEGETVTLAITPDAGYELVSIDVYLYGTTTPIALTGTGLTRTFTMPANHITVVAVFRLIDVSIAPMVPNVPTAFTQNGILYISGLEPGKAWSVYNVLGTLVYQGVANENRAEVTLPGRGIYIVTDGITVVKIAN